MDGDAYRDFRSAMRVARIIGCGNEDERARLINGDDGALPNFNSPVGNAAHICVYLRELGYLRKIVRSFSDYDALLKWLAERDSNGNSPADLARRFEYPEMAAYFDKIGGAGRMNFRDFPLKEGMLEKYSDGNILYTKRKRYVRIAFDELTYSKAQESKDVVAVRYADYNLVTNSKMGRFALIDKRGEKEFAFKVTSRERFDEWIGILQPLMNNIDKAFYFHNFTFKILYEITERTDHQLNEIICLVDSLSFYFPVRGGRDTRRDSDVEEPAGREERSTEGSHDAGESENENKANDVQMRATEKNEGTGDVEFFDFDDGEATQNHGGGEGHSSNSEGKECNFYDFGEDMVSARRTK